MSKRVLFLGAVWVLGVAAALATSSHGALMAALDAGGSEGTLQAAAFSVNDVSSIEGNGGTKVFTFTVSLAAPVAGAEHRVSYRTADLTAVAATASRSSTMATTIPVIGPASPYPLTLDVSGLPGTIDDLAVRLDDLTHTYPEDLDVLLVSPRGITSMFMSDVGGWDDVAGVDVTFREGAPPAPVSHLATGTFAPMNLSPLESLPAPAPAGPYPVPLSGFRGTDPNGTWQLYIEDDFTTDSGTLGGFTLILSLSGTGDYIPSEGELVFPPGVTSLPVHVLVKGDTTVESTERFVLNLSAPVNATIADGQGVGTIFNDDGEGVPVALDDAYSVPFNTPVTVPAPGVLGNDLSNGGGALVATLVTAPAHGTLSLNPNGGFSYAPAAGYAGPDRFVYRASTATNTSNDGVVNLSVAVPTAVDDAYVAAGNTPLTVAAPGVLGNDNENGGGAMTAALVSTTGRGTLSLNPDGSFVYLPGLNFLGVDTFTYHAVTARGAGNPATVTITVNAPTTAQAPTDLVVESVSGNTVTLRFSPPLLGPAPTGYVLKGGLQPSEVLAAIPTKSDAPIFTFLAPSGSFFIRMHTLVGSEESAASNEVPLHVNVPVTPSAPLNLVGLVDGSTVSLAWKNTFAGGPPTNVILRVTGDMSVEVPIGLTETFSFASVPPGTYTIRVREANRGGWSPQSNLITLTFPGACSGAPLPPANFLAYRLGSTIFVRWDPAPMGTAPTGFTLRVTGAYEGNFDTTGRTMSGTVPPGSYKLEAIARNRCGSSAPTPPQTIVVP